MKKELFRQFETSRLVYMGAEGPMVDIKEDAVKSNIDAKKQNFQKEHPEAGKFTNTAEAAAAVNPIEAFQKQKTDFKDKLKSMIALDTKTGISSPEERALAEKIGQDVDQQLSKLEKLYNEERQKYGDQQQDILSQSHEVLVAAANEFLFKMELKVNAANINQPGDSTETREASKNGKIQVIDAFLKANKFDKVPGMAKLIIEANPDILKGLSQSSSREEFNQNLIQKLEDGGAIKKAVEQLVLNMPKFREENDANEAWLSQQEAIYIAFQLTGNPNFTNDHQLGKDFAETGINPTQIDAIAKTLAKRFSMHFKPEDLKQGKLEPDSIADLVNSKSFSSIDEFKQEVVRLAKTMRDPKAVDAHDQAMDRATNEQRAMFKEVRENKWGRNGGGEVSKLEDLGAARSDLQKLIQQRDNFNKMINPEQGLNDKLADFQRAVNGSTDARLFGKDGKPTDIGKALQDIAKSLTPDKIRQTGMTDVQLNELLAMVQKPDVRKETLHQMWQDLETGKGENPIAKIKKAQEATGSALVGTVTLEQLIKLQAYPEGPEAAKIFKYTDARYKEMRPDFIKDYMEKLLAETGSHKVEFLSVNFVKGTEGKPDFFVAGIKIDGEDYKIGNDPNGKIVLYKEGGNLSIQIEGNNVLAARESFMKTKEVVDTNKERDGIRNEYMATLTKMVARTLKAGGGSNLSPLGELVSKIDDQLKGEEPTWKQAKRERGEKDNDSVQQRLDANRVKYIMQTFNTKNAPEDFNKFVAALNDANPTLNTMYAGLQQKKEEAGAPKPKAA